MNTTHSSEISATAVNTLAAKTRLASVGGAVVASLALWGIARMLGVEVNSPGMSGNAPAAIGASHVLTASAVASAAGWGLLAALERFVPTHARKIWLAVAGVVFLLSLGAPLTGPGITTANRVVLALLHVVVASVAGAGLAYWGPARDGRH